MKTALGCFFSLALYLALAGGLAFLIERRIGSMQPALLVGAIAGLFAYGVFGNLFQAAKKLREMVSLAKFVGGREPVDGERFVGIGPIAPSGLDRLVSPITQTPAVAYSYRIRHRGKVWEGWAMVSSRIQAGPHSIRLLAFPDLAFPTACRITKTAVRKAEEYLGGTVFDNANASDIRSSLYRDESGALKRDVGPNDKPSSLKGAVLMERVVLEGDVVTVAGTWSAARGGLVVDPTASSFSVTLKKGEPRPGKLLGEAFTKVVTAAFLLVLVAAGVAGLHFFVPLDTAEELNAGIRFSWLEVEVERFLDERFRPAAIEAGLFPIGPITPGETLQPGEARGRVRSGSAEATVTRVIADRNGDEIEVLLFENDREVARLVLRGRGDLRSLDLLGASVAPAALPPASAAFSEFGENEIGGRISFVVPDGPAAHLRFRTRVAGM